MYSTSYVTRAALYQMIAAQLHHDGHIDAAYAVARSTMCNVQAVQGNPERLASLVSLGLHAEQLGATGSYLSHSEYDELPVLEDALGLDKFSYEISDARRQVLQEALSELEHDDSSPRLSSPPQAPQSTAHPHTTVRLSRYRGDPSASICSGGTPLDDRWYRFTEKAALTLKSSVRALTISGDGRWAGCGTADGAVRVLSIPALHSYHYAAARELMSSLPETVGELPASPSIVNTHVKPQSQYITAQQKLNISLHAVVHVFPPPHTTVQSEHHAVTCCRFHTDNNLLIVGRRNGVVAALKYHADALDHRCDAQADTTDCAFSVQDTSPIRSIRLHPSGQHLLYTTDHPVLRVYHIPSERLLAPPEASEQQPCVGMDVTPPSQHHTGAVWSLDITRDGRVVTTASADGSIRFWDGRTLRTFEVRLNAHSHLDVTSVRFSHTGNYLLSSGMDGRAILWDMRKAQTAVRIYGRATAPHGSVQRPTATFTFREDLILVTGCELVEKRQLVSVYDSYSQLLLGQTMHGDRIRDLRSSPVEQSFLTGGDDATVRLWAPTL